MPINRYSCTSIGAASNRLHRTNLCVLAQVRQNRRQRHDLLTCVVYPVGGSLNLCCWQASHTWGFARSTCRTLGPDFGLVHDLAPNRSSSALLATCSEWLWRSVHTEAPSPHASKRLRARSDVPEEVAEVRTGGSSIRQWLYGTSRGWMLRLSTRTSAANGPNLSDPSKP